MGAAGVLGDKDYMRRALALAKRAADAGEVPVGAVVVCEGVIVGEGRNSPIADHDPTAHAEIMAMRAAALSLHNYRLGGATLYVTLEPCAMCIGAALNARLSRLVFGASDLKAGACGGWIDLTREPQLTHRIDVFGGVCSEESSTVLRQFFAVRR